MTEILNNIEANEFLSAEEITLTKQFIEHGFCAFPIEDLAGLEKIRSAIVALCVEALNCAPPEDDGVFLNSIADRVGVDALNDFRVGIIEGINRESWLRPAYFGLARNALHCLVGNELAMQRRISLSIQMPGDDSSLLPVHCDVWSGDSPFEVVQWLPLVDCFKTKSMFLVPPEVNADVQKRLHGFRGRSSEDLYAEVAPHATWIEIPFGHVVLFNQNLMQGNRVNEENETRWTMNCRFKGAFTPYAEKRIGEFFEPITLRAASRIGLSYELPGGFDEA
jgi:sporadic carbohydrate cluster 2OG-Fe(II) oxygenase